MPELFASFHLNNDGKKVSSKKEDNDEYLSNEVGTNDSEDYERDNFRIIGDATEYDADFYLGNSGKKRRSKDIKNSDYIVVVNDEHLKKADNSKVYIDDNTIDEIIKKIDEKKKSPYFNQNNYALPKKNV